MSHAANPTLGAGIKYTLNITNKSAQAWSFFAYHAVSGASRNLFPVAWKCAPKPVAAGGKTTIQWGSDLDFYWSQSGQVVPGLLLSVSGSKAGNVTSANETNFNLNNGGALDQPFAGGTPGTMSINSGVSVRPNTYAIGIGLSGTPAMAAQAQPNMKQDFTPPRPDICMIAAAFNMREGEVLNPIAIMQNAQVTFTPNVYAMDCTLQSDNTWKVAPAT